MKDLPTSKRSLLSFLKRFHLVVFTVAITLVLSVSVLLLYSVVYKASGEESVPQSTITTSFDQSTIDQINQLKTSSEPSQPLDLSRGRISPFIE